MGVDVRVPKRAGGLRDSLHKVSTSPAPSYRFRVLWNERPLRRVEKVSGLKRTIAVTEHRDGAAPGETSKAPGQVTYHPVTLERAITGDGCFRHLAERAAQASLGSAARGTLLVELQDDTGAPVLQCTLHRAWVSSYEVFADLDVQSDAAAIERVVIEYDTWRIDHRRRAPGLRRRPPVRGDG